MIEFFACLSAVGWLNFLVCQWLGFRIQREYEVDRYGRPSRLVGVELLFPIVPLTGWWSRYLPRARWSWTLRVWTREGVRRRRWL